MDLTFYLGIVAGTFTSVSMLPQLIRIIKEKSAGNLSLLTLGVLLTGLCLWVAYGAVKPDVPVIITNAVASVITLLTIIFTIIYRKS